MVMKSTTMWVNGQQVSVGTGSIRKFDVADPLVRTCWKGDRETSLELEGEQLERYKEIRARKEAQKPRPTQYVDKTDPFLDCGLEVLEECARYFNGLQPDAEL